jgi:hypothetical protein
MKTNLEVNEVKIEANTGVHSDSHLIQYKKEVDTMTTQQVEPQKAIALLKEPNGSRAIDETFKIKLAEAMTYGYENSIKIVKQIFSIGDFYDDITGVYNQILDFVKTQEEPVAILIAPNAPFSLKKDQLGEIITLIKADKLTIHLIGTDLVLAKEAVRDEKGEEFLDFLFVPMMTRDELIKKCAELKDKYNRAEKAY